MSQDLSAIVIPCLNEQHSLPSTCKSLGFGVGHCPPANAVLIVVDNGSEDATAAVASEIQRQSPTGSVIVATETERGYVPPRRRGNRIAMSMAAERGVSIENLIIIQADADTIYSDSYIEAMSNHARQMGQGVVIEACSEPDDDFAEEHAAYIALCDEIDREFESVLSDQSQDVIVDDKTCAYWASDYELWGGHQREYTGRGEEIHSETARLYIRARTFGACRSLCEKAIAKHSDRRTLVDPAYCFATAGFPREAAFKEKWRRMYDGPCDIIEFCKLSNRSKIAMAIRSRRAHTRGLFDLLTWHVKCAIESMPAEEDQSKCGIGLPIRDARAARDRPGLLIEDVLGIVDRLAFEERA